MEYAKGYPCLYAALGYGSIPNLEKTKYRELVKLGTSYHIANRKAGYSTAWANKPRFAYVIVLPKDSVSANDLYKLDSEFNQYFCENGYMEFYINNGGGTEFYDLESPKPYLELMKDFLQKKGLSILTIIDDDPFPIRDLTLTEKEELETENKSIRKVGEQLSFKQKFFSTFLPKGAVPRRIQSELWDLWEKICSGVDETGIYKGIVQWPTGTGKTVAMLILIVLAAERCKRLGIIYRGLLVTPKNDIFNTISSEFNKLSAFGITLSDGSNAKLSKLTIPLNKHVLVMACPQSLLIDDTGMRNLPEINHVHYDEVHRITGEQYFQLLKEMLGVWNSHFLTGTSATPKTSNPEQHRKLVELFDDPYRVIHRCEVDEAVHERWIATPRFRVCITPKCAKGCEAAYVKAFVVGIGKSINAKKSAGLWKGGKVIAFVRSIAEVKAAAKEAIEAIPGATIYLAAGNERTDKEFVEAPADGSVQILFACERYREGSDIEGIDMTAILIGDTISAYILIQIQGRALRKDHEEKEGWCMIMSPCEEGETEQDVFERISLDILTFIGDSRPLVRKDFETYVETYFGDVVVGGITISKKETVERIQAAYVRREYPKRTTKEKYTMIRELNRELGLKSKVEYIDRAHEHSRFIEDPVKYFEGYWNCWYDFLGIDCSRFPQTKADWIRICKEQGYITWEDYKQKRDNSLPENPGELYEDFTNWDKEMGIEEEHVW
jgi:superfamily II DNA or RNA helicase